MEKGQEMLKMTWGEMRDLFMEHESKHPKTHLTGYVVYKQSNWIDAEYSEKERTYKVNSGTNGFKYGKISNCIIGNCLDGKDLGVRLDYYNWDVEFCYILK